MAFYADSCAAAYAIAATGWLYAAIAATLMKPMPPHDAFIRRRQAGSRRYYAIGED